jgi:acyl carrier protein
MNNSESNPLREELQTVFRDVFGDDGIVLDGPMTAEDFPGWDSLAHINLIIAVERHFGIRFATAEISGLKADGQNIGTFLGLINKKLSANK